jgi:hypothetical protein
MLFHAVFFRKPFIFYLDNVKEAENMASLIDGYCCLAKKSTNSLWKRIVPYKIFDSYNSSLKSSDSQDSDLGANKNVVIERKKTRKF